MDPHAEDGERLVSSLVPGLRAPSTLRCGHSPAWLLVPAPCPREAGCTAHTSAGWNEGEGEREGRLAALRWGLL